MCLCVPALVQGACLIWDTCDDKVRKKKGKERQHDREKSAEASHDDGEEGKDVLYHYVIDLLYLSGDRVVFLRRLVPLQCLVIASLD
jgi:hypothetical protein